MAQNKSAAPKYIEATKISTQSYLSLFKIPCSNVYVFTQY